MTRKTVDDLKQLQLTTWYSDRRCPVCNAKMASNGREYWCSECDYWEEANDACDD